MPSYNYILSYNPSATSPSAQQLHVLISQNRDIKSWYLAFPGTYIFKSEKLMGHLNAPFLQFFGETPYIFTWANVTTGALPPMVWDWFNNTQSPFLTKG